MIPPVIEDTTATDSWRRRVAGAWTAATATVAGGIAGLGGLAWWQVPLVTNPAHWGVVGGAVVAGVLARAGWVRWIRPRSGWRPAWQDGLLTPGGPRSGWTLPRPRWLSSRDTTHAYAAMTAFAVPATVVAVADGDPLFAAFTGALVLPATAGLTRRLARRLRFRPGLALTVDGLVTAAGLVRWDAIDEVAVRNPFATERVELMVAGRRRKLVLPPGEVDLPAAELARLIDSYRRDPQRQRTLIRSAGPPDRPIVAGTTTRPAGTTADRQAGAERSEPVVT